MDHAGLLQTFASVHLPLIILDADTDANAALPQVVMHVRVKMGLRDATNPRHYLHSWPKPIPKRQSILVAAEHLPYFLNKLGIVEFSNCVLIMPGERSRV
jgi:hypothetical protein